MHFTQKMAMENMELVHESCFQHLRLVRQEDIWNSKNALIKTMKWNKAWEYMKNQAGLNRCF